MTERLDFSVTTGERFAGGFFDTDCNGWSPIGLVVALYTPLWDAVIRPPGISLVGTGNAPDGHKSRFYVIRDGSSACSGVGPREPTSVVD